MNNFQKTVFVLFLISPSFVFSTELKSINLDPSYSHDKWGTRPRDIYREMGAYVVSFDSNDDNDGNGIGEAWGIPEWIAYEIKACPKKKGKAPKRPSKWMTDLKLFKEKIAPDDSSYEFSSKYYSAYPDAFHYDRGHMCMKEIAYRMGANADWNTHTLLNACPQRDILNRKIWLNLEDMTQKWADKFNNVWIICGPIIYGKKPSKFLGEKGEFQVAIPDAFFKVVVKNSANKDKPDLLAFIYPQEPKGKDWPRVGKKYDHKQFLVSVDEIEKITGLDFLTVLPDTVEEGVESQKVDKIWA